MKSRHHPLQHFVFLVCLFWFIILLYYSINSIIIIGMTLALLTLRLDLTSPSYCLSILPLVLLAGHWLSTLPYYLGSGVYGESQTLPICVCPAITTVLSFLFFLNIYSYYVISACLLVQRWIFLFFFIVPPEIPSVCLHSIRQGMVNIHQARCCYPTDSITIATANWPFIHQQQ